MIELREVTKTYGTTTAVSRLSFAVAEGEVCVLIGPSGCGKTTTLRMINRLIEPTSGSIYVNGVDTESLKPESLRRYIGYAIQSVGLFPHMTVAENIGVVPQLLHWEKSRISDRIEDLLHLVGLSPGEYAGKYPGQLSGGEAQRVGVARALAADPPILLMDEPFGAVDPLTRERLQAQFLQIQQGLRKTVILVTHDLDEAIRLGDKIAIMSSGELVQYDTPETILSHPASKFVHDFVGADRALKRLSRLPVEHYIRAAPSISPDTPLGEVETLFRDNRWLWAVNDAGVLVGWLDRAMLARAGSIESAIVRQDIAEIALSSAATLREALSRMLGQGFKSVPVTDGDGRLLGEVTLANVERATAETGEAS